jgi:hypothetical protein
MRRKRQAEHADSFPTPHYYSPPIFVHYLDFQQIRLSTPLSCEANYLPQWMSYNRGESWVSSADTFIRDVRAHFSKLVDGFVEFVNDKRLPDRWHPYP